MLNRKLKKTISYALCFLSISATIIFYKQEVSAYKLNPYRWETNTDKSYSVNSYHFPDQTPFHEANLVWNNSGGPYKIWRSTPCSATDFNRNGVNEIFKRYREGITAPATTRCSYSGTKLIETDMVFNTSYTFTIGGSSSTLDIQNVATHEIGHILCLDDLYPGEVSPYISDIKEATMYAYTSVNETKKRTLTTDDIEGFKATK